ncbi:MAG: ferritin-like domain-containing protein [Actinomycetota bacterium]|nr:ferritin-like domain-containing protein [Actinomycetota bacterium]MDA8343839.1 ferritin-like domain-containing protein [Actinomycetota bacterium]
MSATMRSNIKLVEDQATRVLTWDYERDRTQLVTLYNKAMGSQWNSVTDLDWSIDVDPERLVREMGDDAVPPIYRKVATLPGSPIATWTEAEFTRLGVELMKARLSQFMHGEQGAMITAAKIVETVPWIDAKYYAATQTMDEARHTEVFAKYLDLKLGDAYPMSPFLEEQITSLIEDGRWDIAYLGMQIVIESLALAAFGELHRTVTEPLLKKLLRYVMSDEARHVAFGILSLGELYRELSSAELKERQEFLAENTLRNRARSTTPEVWDRLGVPVDQVLPYIVEAAQSMGGSVFAAFQRAFFAKLVPNVSKLGLLDANDGWLREKWGKAGLLEFESAVDTAEDYDRYDSVAADRAAAAAAGGQER